MDDYARLVVGATVGSLVLVFFIPGLIVTICIITVVVCICNKKCPLYYQRQSGHRQQPRVGVLVVDCEKEDSIQRRSIKYHRIVETSTTQGTD